MADKNHMPRRMSATQALDFLSRVMEDSDEESSFSSEDEYNIHLSSESDNESEDRSRSIPIDQPQPGPSGIARYRPSQKRTIADVYQSDEDESSSRSTPSIDDSDSRSRSNPKPQNKTRGPNPGDWKQVTTEDEVYPQNFRFTPDRAPAVYADISEESTPLDCFMQLFDTEVRDQVIESINAYAAIKLRMSTPAKRYSVYRHWKPLTTYELYKFLAVIVQIGLDPKPQIRDYWDKSD